MLNRLRHSLYERKYLSLLVALVLLILAYPILDQGVVQLSTLALLLTVVLSFAVAAISEERRFLRTAIVIGVPALATNLIGLATQGRVWTLLGTGLFSAFYLFITVALLRHVVRNEVVTSEELYGAICVYLLVGLLFGTLYTFLEVLNPGSFRFTTGSHAVGVPPWTDLVFFSYVTLTTVGYGDIVPVASAVRSLVMIQGIIGMLYPPILIGRLVSLFIMHSGDGQHDAR